MTLTVNGDGDEGPAGYGELVEAIRAVLAPLPQVAPTTLPGTAAPAEVAVSMPACNAGEFIGEAISSVLRQRDIVLELIVVDDGSTDNTADVVQSIRDPRVSLIRHTRRRGIGASHNAALERSTAPYVAHVDADDFLLPGALRKGVDALARTPSAGQAYAYHVETDQQGWLSAEHFQLQQELITRLHGPATDYRRNLIRYGMVVNPLRIYRRDAIAVVGPFDEHRRYGIDYEMALRIAHHFDIVAVPEFLYCQRVHTTNTQQNLRFRALRFWWDRVLTCRALSRRSSHLLMGHSALSMYSLLVLGLLDAIRPQAPTHQARR